MKDSLDDPCFLFHDGQLLVFHTVSHRNATADPFTFLPAGGHLVANPLGDDLPLILRVLRDRGLTTEVEDDLLDPITNVKVRLVGEDGNAFVILGRCRAALRKAGYPQAFIDTFVSEATAGNYDDLLTTVMRYVVVE